MLGGDASNKKKDAQDLSKDEDHRGDDTGSKGPSNDEDTLDPDDELPTGVSDKKKEQDPNVGPAEKKETTQQVPKDGTADDSGKREIENLKRLLQDAHERNRENEQRSAPRIDMSEQITEFMKGIVPAKAEAIASSPQMSPKAPAPSPANRYDMRDTQKPVNPGTVMFLGNKTAKVPSLRGRPDSIIERMRMYNAYERLLVEFVSSTFVDGHMVVATAEMYAQQAYETYVRVG